MSHTPVPSNGSFVGVDAVRAFSPILAGQGVKEGRCVLNDSMAMQRSLAIDGDRLSLLRRMRLCLVSSILRGYFMRLPVSIEAVLLDDSRNEIQVKLDDDFATNSVSELCEKLDAALERLQALEGHPSGALTGWRLVVVLPSASSKPTLEALLKTRLARWNNILDEFQIQQNESLLEYVRRLEELRDAVLSQLGRAEAKVSPGLAGIIAEVKCDRERVWHSTESKTEEGLFV